MSPNLRIKLDKKINWERGIPFLGSTRESERGEEREAPTSLYDLWISVAQFSSGQELKSIYATRATRGYQKQKISPKIHAKSSGDHGFRVSGTFESFVFALRGRDSSYFCLFSIVGTIWLSFNALRIYLAIFFPKGLFGKIMGYKNSALL